LFKRLCPNFDGVWGNFVEIRGKVRWSQVARRAIEERINDLEEMERIVSKSKLTEKDAKIIAKKIKAGMAKRFNEHSS